MNQKDFMQYVEKSCDCDTALLDAAVSRGIHRAKAEMPDKGSQKVDIIKVLHVAGAGAVAAALCLMISAEPVRTAMPDIMPVGSLMTQSGAEILHGYMLEYIDTLTDFFGGN